MNINDFRIKLEFNVEEINMVFKFLGSNPYDQVAGLIDELKRQIDPQLIPLEEVDTPEDINKESTDHPFG